MPQKFDVVYFKFSKVLDYEDVSLLQREEEG